MIWFNSVTGHKCDVAPLIVPVPQPNPFQRVSLMHCRLSPTFETVAPRTKGRSLEAVESPPDTQC